MSSLVKNRRNGEIRISSSFSSFGLEGGEVLTFPGRVVGVKTYSGMGRDVRTGKVEKWASERLTGSCLAGSVRSANTVGEWETLIRAVPPTLPKPHRRSIELECSFPSCSLNGSHLPPPDALLQHGWSCFLDLLISDSLGAPSFEKRLESLTRDPCQCKTPWRCPVSAFYFLTISTNSSYFFTQCASCVPR